MKIRITENQYKKLKGIISEAYYHDTWKVEPSYYVNDLYYQKTEFIDDCDGGVGGIDIDLDKGKIFVCTSHDGDYGMGKSNFRNFINQEYKVPKGSSNDVDIEYKNDTLDYIFTDYLKLVKLKLNKSTLEDEVINKFKTILGKDNAVEEPLHNMIKDFFIWHSKFDTVGRFQEIGKIKELLATIDNIDSFLKSPMRGSRYYIRKILENLVLVFDETNKTFVDFMEYMKRLQLYLNSNDDTTRGKLKKKLSNITKSELGVSLSDLFKIKDYVAYEKSFTDKGFGYPEDKGSESRIHNLKGGYFSNEIKRIGDIEDREEQNHEIDVLTESIKNNIINYVADNEIEKYDIVSDKDFVVDGVDLVKKGDKIEVKKNPSGVGDSYYAEPLASPMKQSGSIIASDDYLKSIYNEVIDNLFWWLENAGSDTGKKILEKMVHNTKGVFLDDNVFIPINNIEFYLSNKGKNSCSDHRRLTIRYKIKNSDDVYKLINTEGDDYTFQKGGDVTISDKYINCSNTEPKVKYNT